jgi:hypothetical protein
VTAQQAENTAGSVVSRLVEQELMGERERATALVERALKLVTAVGALVTLIFAFVAVVPESQVGVSAQAFWWLVGALVLFVFSGVLYLLPLGTPPYRRRFVPRCLKPLLPPTLKPLVTIEDVTGPATSTEPAHAYIDIRSWPEDWNGPSGTASERVAKAQACVLKNLRARNKYLLRIIGWGVLLDVTALGLLAVAVCLVLWPIRR